MLSENKAVRKNAEYPNNRIDRCGLSDSKSDTYSNSVSPSDVHSVEKSNISTDRLSEFRDISRFDRCSCSSSRTGFFI